MFGPLSQSSASESSSAERPISIRKVTFEDIKDIEFSKGVMKVDDTEVLVDGINVLVQGEEKFLPREKWAYKGEGVTNYSSKFIDQKRLYVEAFGVDTGDLDPEQITTCQLMLHYITAPLELMLDGGTIEDIEDCLWTVNKKIEKRLDEDKTRVPYSTGKTFQDYRGSSNPKDLVAEAEFNMLLDRVLQAFPRKKPQEMV